MNKKEIYTERGNMTPTAWLDLLQKNVHTAIGTTGQTLATITLGELHEALRIEPPEFATPELPRDAIKTVEVAAALGISRNAAYKLVKSDGFPSFRVGTRLIIPRKKFEQWMEEQTKVKHGEPASAPVQEPEDLS